ncbi:MAG: acetate--CoA ligase family protein [Candidatus Daviesbacteria bacterium]|nr:acetate--CoA ligase family protein [Candidatus Daviesbacteria bacterium]
MILYEYEGKRLLAEAGIEVPKGLLIEFVQGIQLNYPIVLKAQVLSGKRAEAGGILVVENPEELKSSLNKLLGGVINKEKVKKVLAEERIEFEKEFYVSVSYDTNTRGPILTISEQGGTGIEGREVNVYPIDPVECTLSHSERSEESSPIMEDPSSMTPQDDNFLIPHELLHNLINLFFKQDCLLLEINPLVHTKVGEWIALDAKIKLDDAAAGRHKDWDFPSRSAPGHTSTQNEIEAKKIDESDYRGVAGSAYFDLDGDIAVLASGGGASLTALDALIKVGGRPANYTEYGGNPPREKVAKLTKIVLGKPNLNGLWVVGALANFTNIYETLSGFIDGLREAEKLLGKKFEFPIVIRRAGPEDQKARQMLSEVKDFDLHIYGEETSITESAVIIAKLAKEYKTSLLLRNKERRKDDASS